MARETRPGNHVGDLYHHVFGTTRRQRLQSAGSDHFKGVQSLEPRLMLAASITGSVYQSNGAGGGVAGVTVLVDTNRNGVTDPGERTVVTDAQGDYAFTNTPPGKYNIVALVKDDRYWTADTFDRLIGLGSFQDSGWISAWNDDQTIDYYAALWEIDPETGFAVNSFPIVGDGDADPDDVNFQGLTAIPNRPGWYLAQNQDQGTAAWNAFFECEANIVTIHWEPGMAYAEAEFLSSTGHDLGSGGGMDFDPTGDPTVVYGGIGDDYVWPWNVEYGEEWMWQADIDLLALGWPFAGTSDIGDVFIPSTYYGHMGDLAFDGYGNLYLFAGRLYRLDKTNGQTLETIEVGAYDHAAEWNYERANFWTAGTGLWTLNPTTRQVTTIRDSFDFGVPTEGYPRYLIEGLEYIPDGFTDKPVELGSTNVTGVHFGHTYHAVGIHGRIYRDTNANGVRDPGENQGLSNHRVFFDGNGNNRYDDGETYRWTDSQGGYEFANLRPGTYWIAVESAWGDDDVTWGGNVRPGLDVVNLQAGQYHTVDFGVGRGGEINGVAFDDYNANGQWNAVLSWPVPGWTVPNAAIPDSGMVQSTLDLFSEGAAVSDMNVYLDIDHPNAGDLRVELVSPAGTNVRLFQHVGGSGDNFNGTFLDDEALTSITTVTEGDAPFLAAYQPEQSLMAFDGELVDGTWMLKVFDDVAGNTGLLKAWGLLAEVPGTSEPGLAGVTVYVDQDHNGVLNTTMAQGDSTGAVAIPDGGSTSATIQIDDVHTPIADLDVYLDITHPYVTDLIIDLVSPLGTRVRLMQMAGEGGEDFTGTILDDEAAVSIEDAVSQDAPFTGWWRPDTSLTDFDGESPNGTWTLMITDIAAGEAGTLNFWSIRMTLGDFVTTTDAAGAYHFSHLPPGPLTVRQQLTAQRSPTRPRPAGEEVVEHFEFNLNHYVQQEAGQGSTLSTAAAYEGAKGLIPGRWLVGIPELEAPVARKGDTISAMLKFPDAADGGWAWLGIGAHEGGAIAIGVSPGITSTGGGPGALAIWQWTGGWDGPAVQTRKLTETPLGYLSSEVWYRLDVEWGLNDTIVAQLYLATDEPSSYAHAVAVVPWPVREGPLAFRGKLSSTFPDYYFDRVSIRRGSGQTVLSQSGLAHNVIFGSAADGLIAGWVFQDSNGNGIGDDGRGLPGWHVYDDSNFNCLFDPPIRETFGDVRNWSIDDLAAAAPRFEVSGVVGAILDVDVTLDIDHYAVGDLTAYLVSPQGTRVELFSGLGGANDHFPMTIFDDAAATPITSATWSLASGASFQPTGRLADFNAEDPNGWWRFVVIDNSDNDDEGIVDNALITLSVGELETFTDSNGFYLGGELPVRTYRLRQEEAPGWIQTAPAVSPWREVHLPGGGIVLGQDFGNTRVGSVAGAVWHDHNANGVREGGDEGVGGQRVFLDVDDNGARDLFPGQVFVQPAHQPIPDEGTITSLLPVFEVPGRILDVDVQLSIEHAYDADLHVWLHSPQGTRIKLFGDVGGSGESFWGTWLDDEAGMAIADGMAPFSGAYWPQEELAFLDGQAPNGVWMLEIHDDAGGDVGTLAGWQIVLTTGDPAAGTDGAGEYHIGFVPPADWPVRLDQHPDWAWLNPADGRQVETVLIGSDVTGVDFSVSVSMPECSPGDADGDGVVDDDDLSLLLANWGSEIADCTQGEFSGVPPVNDDDLSLLLANWTGTSGGGRFAVETEMSLPALRARADSLFEPVSVQIAAGSTEVSVQGTVAIPSDVRRAVVADLTDDADPRLASLRPVAARAGVSVGWWASRSRTNLDEALVNVLSTRQLELPV